MNDVPGLGLGFAAELFGDAGRRVDLDGEVLVGVDDFGEQREAFRRIWA
tara:strand:+ start:342 stop:488 length:147 start_codon:yes stop_codon:yes gene_type:complete